MSLFDWMIMLAAVGALFALVCRLDALHWRTDKRAVILLHIALASAVMAAAVHAYQGATDVQDVCIVAAGIAWIVHSLPAWRRRVVLFADTVPGMLDEADMPRVGGGKSCG
jgi:hypothetical protein